MYVVLEYRRQKGIVCFEILNEKDCQDQKCSWEKVLKCAFVDNENLRQFTFRCYFSEIAAYNT